MTQDKTAIRNAATVIVVRDRLTAPRILMGQRGAKAAFMPNKFVFPGGAVDAEDFDIALAGSVPAPCFERLSEEQHGATLPGLADALAVAAVRELWEETGLRLGTAGRWQSAIPKDWAGFADQGHVPNAAALQFVFRAITPPGRPRRFDARFFQLDAEHIQGDIDDFSHASDELSHLQWVPLQDAREFDLPFITEVVLAEVQAHLTTDAAPASVPFFKNTDEAGLFKRLYGRSLTKHEMGG
ncbi:NUDIX domain-containing protein [Cognatishimia sp. WU-CL00825]|uniref:NUDIX hydrolase n=1 Tax=Cognatishimia sp. WU-CL00825 TaxID=3127658 RepID=UPI0031062B3B